MVLMLLYGSKNTWKSTVKPSNQPQRKKLKPKKKKKGDESPELVLLSCPAHLPAGSEALVDSYLRLLLMIWQQRRANTLVLSHTHLLTAESKALSWQGTGAREKLSGKIRTKISGTKSQGIKWWVWLCKIKTNLILFTLASAIFSL